MPGVRATLKESCHKPQYRGDWAEPLVIRALQELARRPELAPVALETYRQAKASEQLQPDVERLRQQLAELQRQEQATVKAQIAGVMAGADSSIYESHLRDLTAQRSHITTLLTRAG